MGKRQTRQSRSSRYNKMEQDATMPRAGNRFASLPKESFDLRYWPSTTAPETPSTSPVRNYLLHDWPPYKTELPSDLRRVLRYFQTDYEDRHPHPKILSVHIGTGEIMMSEAIPPTRRLWDRFVEEYLSLVHHTLVKWQPDPTLHVEPHPDNDFFPAPRRSSAFGTDFPQADNTVVHPTRRGSPSREDIMADYFKTLREEGEDHKVSMRDRRHQKRDGKPINADSDGDGDVKMQDIGNPRKPNNKKRRQMLRLNNRLAATVSEDVSWMRPAQREGAQSMAEGMSDGVAGGEVDDKRHIIQDGLLGHGYMASLQPLDMSYPANGTNVLSLGNNSVADQVMADTHPPNMHQPAAGDNGLPVNSQDMEHTAESTDGVIKPVMCQMHDLTLQHELHTIDGGPTKEYNELDMEG